MVFESDFMNLDKQIINSHPVIETLTNINALCNKFTWTQEMSVQQYSHIKKKN